MKPPWVGSGCSVTSVATGSRSTGTASSPTRLRPSAVCSVTGVRRAGSTVTARISSGPPYVDRWCSVIGLMPRSVPGALDLRAAPAAGPPARGVPVPPLREPGLLVVVAVVPAERRGPGDDVRGGGPDLLVAARAPVGAGRR